MSGLADRLARPLLMRLDAETAHRAAVALMRVVPRPAPVADDPSLAVEAFGLRFPNPVGLAAGFDKDATLGEAVLPYGFGFTEAGTLTPEAQGGNPRPRVFRLSADRAVVNRYGFNNSGHAPAVARLRQRRRHGILGVNIGANKDSVDRAADYVAGVQAFAPLADYLTVNVSSPNTPGLRDLQGSEALDDLLARVLAARDAAAGPRGRTPVLLKIAPDLDEAQLDSIVGVARRRGIDGLIVSNTTLSRPDSLLAVEARQAGGLSGRPLFAPSTRVLALAYQRVEGMFPLIGAGGIDSPDVALAKIRAGATLVQLYSGLVFEGLGLVPRIKRHIGRAASTAGSLKALVGVDAADWAHRPLAGAMAG